MPTDDNNTAAPSASNLGKGNTWPADVKSSAMANSTTMNGMLALAARGPQERRRTIVAIVSASIISLVVWGLIVALNIQ
jgi:hypothetical protein